MQNFGRFYTTFDFDREYLGNGLSKNGKLVDRRQCLLRYMKKGPVNFGPLITEIKV